MSHIVKRFEYELGVIKELTSEMAMTCRDWVQRSMSAYALSDRSAAENIAMGTNTMPMTRRQVSAIRSLTSLKRSPAANDYRLVEAAETFANELPYVADAAKRISMRVAGLPESKVPSAVDAGVGAMAKLASLQSAAVLDAYISVEMGVSNRASEWRAAIKEYEPEIAMRMRRLMSSHIEFIDYGVATMLNCNDTQIIAAHVERLAEAVYFLVEGKHYKVEGTSLPGWDDRTALNKLIEQRQK